MTYCKAWTPTDRGVPKPLDLTIMQGVDDRLKEDRHREKKVLLFVAALVVVGIVVGLAVSTCSDSPPDPPDPKEVARQWVADITDAASEDVLRLVLDALDEEGLVGTVIAELGGEWLEDRINEKMTWTISEPVSEGDSHIVVVTGNARVEVDRGFIKGRLEVTVPIELAIQEDRVTDSRLLADKASVSVSN